MKFKTSIVGMRFRPDVSESDLTGLSRVDIKLVREPDNIHDLFAVKCIANGKHIGYIVKEDARQISPLLASQVPYAVQYVGRHSNSIQIVVNINQETSASSKRLAQNTGTEEKGNATRLVRSEDKMAPEKGATTNPNCFVATHCYGPDDERTEYLRMFRDRRLMGSIGGRVFVSCYYKTSPLVVRMCRSSPSIDRIVRHSLSFVLFLMRILLAEK